MDSKELLEKALCCNRCGTCRGVVQDRVPDPSFATQCPSGMTFFGAHEPAGLMYLARGIAQDDLKWSEDLARVLYSCTLCGYCEDLCQRGYRHTPAVTILEELRRIIPDELKPASIKKAAGTAKVPGNQKLDVLKQFGIIDMSTGRKADTVFFADNYLIANAPKLKEIGFILQKSGKKVGCFCSEPLPPLSADILNSGSQEELERCIDKVDEKIEDYGIKKIIVYNPESLSVLKRFCMTDAEFIPITSIYADMLRRKEFRKVKLPAVTYQDPCHLGRYAKEYAAPREVIARLGLNLKEMWRSGHNSLCCGAGGGVLLNDPSLAKKYASARWYEAKATGAKMMITACPYCHANMQRSKPKGFRVVDITTLVAKAYGYTGKEAGR